MDAKQITVGEMVEVLKKLPQNAPVFVRPKYFGTIEQWQDAPVKASGISEMHPSGQSVNVTILI